MQSGVNEGCIKIGEAVVLVGEEVEGADCSQHLDVLGAWSFEQHRDVTRLELGHDLTEGLRTGGVEHLELGEAEDDDPHVRDSSEFGEESLGRTEEQCAVDAVRHDVFCEQCGLGFGGDFARWGHAGFADQWIGRATARNARSAATAIPSSTATMRSNAIVAAAVRPKTSASDRVRVRRPARCGFPPSESR